MKHYNHNLSAPKMFTCNMGPLYPIGCQEVLPGDVFRHSTKLLIRTAPLLAPVMHPVHATVHHWFVPTRLLWNSWEPFITGGTTGLTGDDPAVFPTMTSPAVTGYAEGSLQDYFGIPTGVPNLEHSALQIRAYDIIFNEWYRDEQLQTQLAVLKTDGNDATTPRALLTRAWNRDRFTAARPEPLLGDDVTIPLSGNVPVKGIGKATQTFGTVGPGAIFETGESASTAFGNSAEVDPSANDERFFIEEDPNNAGFPGIFGDLAETQDPASLLALREAFAILRFKENRNRMGGRYVEYLRALGVNPSDARLQRPEYLGGGRQTLQFSEVLSTAETDVDSDYTPVGALKGHGIASLRSNRYQRYFEEHGFVITLFNVQPITAYSQGLHRQWNRRTKFDFWQPELENIGEEQIPVKEVYAAAADPELGFGWVPRYDDYRYPLATIAGEFRSSLNFWTMFRDFSSEPSLNATFIQANPTDRIYATGSASHQLQVMAYHDLRAKRFVKPRAKNFVR